MMNLDEYIRFRHLEHTFHGFNPQKQEYLGVRVFKSGDAGPMKKYDYFFHQLFGTIVLYDVNEVGKTPLCEQIDEEIKKESLVCTKT